MALKTGFNFKKYSKEAYKWFEDNFGTIVKTEAGKKYQHQPLLGIVEELGELSECLETDNPGTFSGIKDAVGDTMVYITDYCRVLGFSIDEVQPKIHRVYWGPQQILKVAGKLCHAHLKMEQGIRGSKEEHLRFIRFSIEEIINMLHTICWDYNIDFDECMQETWDLVSKRNWVKFPKNGVSE